MSGSVDQTTRLLHSVRAGDAGAAAQLMELVYAQLKALAASYMQRQAPGHTLQPTALVHEAFVKLIDSRNQEFAGRAHFFAVAAKAMRHILVDHARASGADKRGGDWKRVTLDEGLTPSNTGSDVDVLAVDEALRQLAELDPRQAEIVELRFFSGLTVEEVATVLGVSRSTVEDDWRMARAWLARRLAAARS